jgi:hypothetical protein
MDKILNLPLLNTADGIAQPGSIRRAAVELAVAAAIFAAAVFGANSIFASSQPGAVIEIETQAGLAIARQGNQALHSIRQDARQLAPMPEFEPAVAATDIVVAETVDGRSPRGRP